MAKQVFLTNYVQNGQVHLIMDPITGQKKKPGYRLFAEKFEAEIKDEDIKILLTQNPVALSDTKISKSTIESTQNFETAGFSMPRGFTMDKLLANATVSELETALRLKSSESPGDVHGNLPPVVSKEDFIFDEVAEKALNKIVDMDQDDLKALKPVEITNLGADLGISIPAVGKKKEETIAMLEARASELAVLDQG